MTSYLIAGASRSIGCEMVNQLSKLSSTSIVYAGVRNPSAAPENFSSDPKIHTVQLDVLSQSDVDAAVETVQKTTGSIDVLIINAGAATGGYVSQCSNQQIQEMFDINTLAPHRLIQAFLPLVRAGVQKKIIAVGSSAGSFGVFRPIAREGVLSGAYGMSKASLHFMMMLYAAELTPNEGILFAAVNPGFVGTTGALDWMKQSQGAQEKLDSDGSHTVPVQQSVEGVLKVLEELTEERSGDLLEWDGSILPY
ncbi:hypothetical protein MMC07_002718 [Pseudocyphellaria aurata]|nr:hypothetical protein [Pseudocyphellaria aurata]